MDENPHNVKWLDYTHNMLQIQKSLYLSSSMYDVIIAVGESRFKAHQLVLAAASEYFSEIFKNVPSNMTQTVIIPELNPNLIEPLLVFMYTGEVYVQPNCLPPFLECCSFMKIKGFVNCDCYINGLKMKHSDALVSAVLTENSMESANQSLEIQEYSINTLGESDEKMEDEIIYESDENRDDSQIENSNNKKHEFSAEIEEFLEELSDNDLTVKNVLNHKNKHNNKKHHKETDTSENRLPSFENINEIQLLNAFEDMRHGKTIVQVSEEYNIPKSTIYLKLRQNTEYRNLYRTIRHSVLADAVNAVTIDGLSLQQASTYFAISKTVLWRKLKKNNLYKPEERMHAFRSDAMAAIKRGESLTSISRKYKIPLSTLHRDKVRLYDQGKLPQNCKVKKRDSGPDFQNRLKAALACCEQGLSQKVASEMHNIPKSTIWRHFQHLLYKKSMGISEGGQ